MYSTLCPRKSNPYTMCDRNVKSEYILIKLCALVFEYICERTTKFHEKVLFDTDDKISRFPIQRCLLQSLVTCKQLA